MMLKRQDLAKEFSLVVQQEIKNHNDLVLACNVSLDEFRRKICELEKYYDKRCDQIDSAVGEQASEIRKFEENLKKSLAYVSSSLNDMQALMLSQLEGIKNSMNNRESYFLTIEGFKEFEHKVDQWMAHLKLSFSMQKDFILEEIKKSFVSMKSYVDDYVKALDSKINEENKSVREINKCLDYFSVQFGGYTREIEASKKRCFIIDKNIENLYTQLKRQQEKSS